MTSNFTVFWAVWLCIAQVTLSQAMSTAESGSPYLYCSNFHPQTTLGIHQITGYWYGSELLQHHDGDNRTTVVNSCVVIHIAESVEEYPFAATSESPSYADDSRRRYYGQAATGRNQPPGYKYLRLVWSENDSDQQISLRYNETTPGFWESARTASKSVADPAYQIYTGTLQVMKAVDNHLVITFCQTLRETGELFSILLTRKPNTLTGEETSRIRGMLKRRGLDTTSVRRVCNGAGIPASGWAVWLGMAVAMAAAAMRWPATN